MAQRQRKRIVLIHYTVPPVVGGVETTLAHHARLLAQDGHRVRLIAGRGRAWDSSIEVRCTRLADSRSPAHRLSRLQIRGRFAGQAGRRARPYVLEEIRPPIIEVAEYRDKHTPRSDAAKE